MDIIHIGDVWPRVLRLAEMRYEYWRRAPGFVDWGPQAMVVGVAGEVIAGRVFGVRPRLMVGPDDGYDLVLGGERVNVVATRWRDHGRVGLQIPADETLTADLYMLAMVKVEERAGALLGWATAQEINRCEIRTDRPIPCRDIRAHELHPIEPLVEALWGDRVRSGIGS